MLKKWGDHYLVGGRKHTEAGPVTALSWLVNDELVEALELPSGGDTSYSGFVALSPQRGLFSYYSSHEGSGDQVWPRRLSTWQICAWIDEAYPLPDIGVQTIAHFETRN